MVNCILDICEYDHQPSKGKVERTDPQDTCHLSACEVKPHCVQCFDDPTLRARLQGLETAAEAGTRNSENESI